MGLPLLGLPTGYLCWLRSAQAIWAPPQGQGKLGQGQWASVEGGAWCLILNLLAVVGPWPCREVTASPTGSSPESGPLSHRFFPQGLWES